MNIDQIKQVFLIGIGGIGMSGLARYFYQLGCTVIGYDKTETDLTLALVSEGITVFYQDNIQLVPERFLNPSVDSLVIFTPAVPKDLKIKNYFIDRGFELYKRSQVLGFISASRFTIGVAGTHGKTTTSTMIAHILKDSGYDCSAFLGGISSNYNTNVLFGDNNVVVVEADEYDRSFLTLHPNIAVVTSADADHLDIYGDESHLIDSFKLFLDRVVEDGKSIVKVGLPFEGNISYSSETRADAYAENIHVDDGEFHFDYIYGDMRVENIRLGIPGLHNVENAVAAITVAILLEIDMEKIVTALANFKGAKRRFEYIVRTPEHVYVDDYAHHPEELRAFLNSMRKLYPTKKLTVVFQPHLFTRTRDFVDGFAEVLGMADELLLMEIYPARELPIDGVNSSWLLNKIGIENKRVVMPQDVLDRVMAEKPELIVTVGAGDIDRLVRPLKTILENE
ncbi:UDP-N-acetylmuramate--L-alanine ligase [Sphingobacterium alkalisoli]|uniref:UDP-N-acetylmuramate--L-alanine ligase n=1 Tax=Sphingobacterium alkalisoli TaxID=1874115 RepID=A0A4V6WF07_9SPHI|nr:UDP-N-acetylmuramate--L-alanine ligase [Sphingobacterium alkalisoli]TJY60759.1 UDP-N-acetylmuramate--L-alanine ligase [Sphingobacterium alkalisoli]GGH31770.1 UDP-N-acetylmuramate--L-alanine ligase [Sphingobacterium alkalisoli]